MNVNDISSRVASLLKDDQFLVEVKMSLGKVAVSIDKPAGITIEECSALSRALYDQMEAVGLTLTHELEVGSPGMDTPLKVPAQYLRRINREVRVLDADGKEYRGILKSANNQGFSVEVQRKVKEQNKKITLTEVVNFEYEKIKETKLILNF
ncbi:MAG: ribosome assembly cofactor RimP [Bacteroidetes bacterium]|nr:ribosome assembly cofactor RimP [Bacteroidota bacterium]